MATNPANQRFKQFSPPNFQQPFLRPDVHPPAKQAANAGGSGLTFATTNWLQNLFNALKSAPEIPPTVPATSSSTGTPGQVAYDATHFYVCVNPNSWIRFTGTSF